MHQSELLLSYMSNLNIELYTAAYNSCDLTWRDLDYTPDYSKLYYICDGDGWLKIDGQEYFPKKGQLILMPEGVQQSYSYINEHPYRKYWCHFRVTIGGVNLFNFIQTEHLCLPQHAELVTQLFEELVTLHNSNEIYAPLLAKSKLMELFAHFMMSINEESIRYKHRTSVEKLAQVLAYIEEHIEQNVTIDELAEVACMHPNYFIRIFKQQMGVPPLQYITRKKMNQAKELLLTSTCSISEIADQLGFHDMFYFSKQFKKNIGTTPTAFRKQWMVRNS